MKNRKYERNVTDKIAIKGVLSGDCSYITFINDDKNEEEVSVAKCLKPFANQEIIFTLSNKTTEDLEDKFEEE